MYAFDSDAQFKHLVVEEQMLALHPFLRHVCGGSPWHLCIGLASVISPWMRMLLIRWIFAKWWNRFTLDSASLHTTTFQLNKTMGECANKSLNVFSCIDVFGHGTLTQLPARRSKKRSLTPCSLAAQRAGEHLQSMASSPYVVRAEVLESGYVSLHFRRSSSNCQV